MRPNPVFLAKAQSATSYEKETVNSLHKQVMLPYSNEHAGIEIGNVVLAGNDDMVGKRNAHESERAIDLLRHGGVGKNNGDKKLEGRGEVSCAALCI